MDVSDIMSCSEQGEREEVFEAVGAGWKVEVGGRPVRRRYWSCESWLALLILEP